MENKKTKKTKTIHMRYPAPYSWSQTGPYERKPSTMKKSVSYDNKNKYSKTKAPPKCCDPYAPHLKYGIFHRKNSKEIESSKISLNKTTSEQISKEGYIKSPDEPYFIIRPLNKRHTKHLSVSEVLHVDIQPRIRKSPMRASSSIRFHK
ncbi:uncharacterized protein LOC125061326 [Pieris napi]|uniref:uncharacterized protein LOC125061326 n=1 Tax=Pieris napi TaxID=78633 RepID=UPI001FBB67EE|nr:uncharacterized protein LOC125061326 [Pieris napi]